MYETSSAMVAEGTVVTQQHTVGIQAPSITCSKLGYCWLQENIWRCLICCCPVSLSVLSANVSWSMCTWALLFSPETNERNEFSEERLRQVPGHGRLFPAADQQSPAANGQKPEGSRHWFSRNIQTSQMLLSRVGKPTDFQFELILFRQNSAPSNNDRSSLLGGGMSAGEP